MTETETRFLNHVTMFGTDGYPVTKETSRRWVWNGLNGSRQVFRTKTAAFAAVDVYVDALRDKKAGR